MNNDRLKFRVWNIEHGFYCDQMTEMVINSDGFCYDNGVRGDYSEHDGFVIEQCTGLKDKNGNLIYEGDIVKSMIRTGYIKWNKGNMTWFVYVLKSNEIIALNSYLDGELEIIGNIHEQA